MRLSAVIGLDACIGNLPTMLTAGASHHPANFVRQRLLMSKNQNAHEKFQEMNLKVDQERNASF
jgi:hypothetical protein